MNIVNGAKARTMVAHSATPGRGSATRTNAAKASTAIAPHSGSESHGAPTSMPGNNMAGPPEGNCANVRPSALATSMLPKNSACGPAGRHRRPPAKICAWRSCVISSMNNGCLPNTRVATARYAMNAQAAMAIAVRRG